MGFHIGLRGSESGPVVVHAVVVVWSEAVEAPGAGCCSASAGSQVAAGVEAHSPDAIAFAAPASY